MSTQIHKHKDLDWELLLLITTSLAACSKRKGLLNYVDDVTERKPSRSLIYSSSDFPRVNMRDSHLSSVCTHHSSILILFRFFPSFGLSFNWLTTHHFQTAWQLEYKGHKRTGSSETKKKKKLPRSDGSNLKFLWWKPNQRYWLNQGISSHDLSSIFIGVFKNVCI